VRIRVFNTISQGFQSAGRKKAPLFPHLGAIARIFNIAILQYIVYKKILKMQGVFKNYEAGPRQLQ